MTIKSIKLKTKAIIKTNLSVIKLISFIKIFYLFKYIKYFKNLIKYFNYHNKLKIKIFLKVNFLILKQIIKVFYLTKIKV